MDGPEEETSFNFKKVIILELYPEANWKAQEMC